ncbi:MAG: DNA mismatch repair protein MutS [Pyrinomonadaceae bacterium]
MESATPMLRQYFEIKKQYPGTILFFRLGDFYEMFNEDAVTGARELNITLTARHKESKNPIPMCGVPHHAAANYIARLVKKGYRVAICEQTEQPTKGTKLVNRDVVRVVTPGTAIDTQLLEAKESAYLAAVTGDNDRFGLALLDLSTGDFRVTETEGSNGWSELTDSISSFSTREILFPESLQQLIGNTYGKALTQYLPDLIGNDVQENVTIDSRYTLTQVDNSDCRLSDDESLLTEQFGTKELTAFGLLGRTLAITAAATCIRYIRRTQKSAAEHISEIRFFESSDNMILDAVTLANLEIIESRSEFSNRTLLGVIDQTVTGMGGRLLRSWLLRPLIKRSEIQTRLLAVSELGDPILRGKIRSLLKDVTDIERLVGRLNLGNASPRDLNALNRSLCKTPEINFALNDATSLLLQVLSENIFELPEIRALIEASIADDPPTNLTDGGVIRPGFNAELDELRNTSLIAKQTIAAFEDSERERTGIGNLKVRFNSVFGYYIEISKGQLSRVPESYERRQTLANAERFTTPELKDWERKVLGAEERIIKLEQDLFAEIVTKVRSETSRLQSTARAIATLDVLESLAETASARNFVCPMMHDGDEIEIKNGRHPVVEAFLGDSFIPNDSYLNNSTERLLIITGANMGGKSTILRQIALIQILAQIGSFVPAGSAKLPIADRIWTRVGASDDLASGRSTFMVEMTETATILHNATPRSLILLDEIGRGTSTFDGLSIAWAVAEYLHDSPDHSAKTVFATHYHELTELAEELPGASNYQITATEADGDVVFLHKLEKGKASKSYGIAVAKLAGLPASVIARAKEVLARLEEYELAVFADETPQGAARAVGQRVASQFSLFSASNESVIDSLRALDAEALSPEQCKDLLAEICSEII